MFSLIRLINIRYWGSISKVWKSPKIVTKVNLLIKIFIILTAINMGNQCIRIETKEEDVTSLNYSKKYFVDPSPKGTPIKVNINYITTIGGVVK